MVVPEAEYERFRKELDECSRPLFFFGDDSDGLASFILLYRYKKEGKGVCVKAQPVLNDRFKRMVDEYQPDKIFVLDIPGLDQDFVDQVKASWVWIDHHEPSKMNNVKVLNPRMFDDKDNIATSHLCYNIVKQDLWISMVGVIGDWQLPEDLTAQLAKEFPKLMPGKYEKPNEALFDSPFSKVIRIYNFLLKGPTKEVNKSVKILTRINDPYELLEEKTPQAKWVMKRFNQINSLYESLLNDALEKVDEDNFLVFTYEENKMSFTGELANEFMHRFPEKTIVVCRRKSGDMKCSLRAPHEVNLAKAVERALVGVEGYGGGHRNACGGCIKEYHFDTFIDNLKKETA